MSRPRVQIVPHLSDAELIQKYETCQDAKIKSYWQVMLLMSQQDPYLRVEQVAEQVNFSADWVRKLVHRYNRLGPASITHEPRSLRKTGHAIPPKLSKVIKVFPELHQKGTHPIQESASRLE